MTRFRLLSFPLDDLALNTELRKPDFSMNEPAKTTRFPLRALRYWWVFHFLEHLAQNRPLTIVDMGVDDGQMTRYYRGAAHVYPGRARNQARWIALDVERSARLLGAGYDVILQCDFDQGLPLGDRSADVVICLHVIEHLPRPAHAMQEIFRILKPGGLLLAGSPTAPAAAAFFIQRWLRKKRQAGRLAPRGHLHSFSPGAWKRLVADCGLELTFLAGGYFLRMSGSFLENFALWARLNLFWGASFPSLGSELFLCAARPDESAREMRQARG